MTPGFRTPRPLPAARVLAVAAAFGAAALLGCDGNPTGPLPVLPPLSRIVIALAGDTTVTHDTLTVGDVVAFTATVYDTGNALVNTSASWTSTDPQVFSVTRSGGMVTARGEGAAWLVAAAGNRADSVAILVLPAARGWVQQTSNSSRTLNGVFVRPDGRFACVVGDAGEILTSGDAGATWTRRASSTSFNLNAVWFTGPGTGWAVGNSGTILRTLNGGVNWTLVPSSAGENLRDVFFSHPDTGWVVGTAGAILRTVNGGVSWQKQNPTGFALHGVAFSEPRFGWAVGDNGTILGTVNRGVDWTVVSPAITSQSLRAVAARGRFLNWAAGALGVTPRTLDNAGSVEWELQNAGAANDLDGVAFVGDLTGFACGTNGVGIVLRTGDGGQTWSPQTVPNGTPLHDVFFVDALRGWAVGANGRILHTASGGEN